jgi:hypothetical protein
MTDPHPQQRRHFARIRFDTEYQLRVPSENTTWTGKLVDLSLHGALIKRPQDFDHAIGDKLELELRLSQDDIKIDMQAHIAHVHDDLIGLECEHIDVESMTHLRRILELNLGDPHLMEREIPEMIERYKS